MSYQIENIYAKRFLYFAVVIVSFEVWLSELSFFCSPQEHKNVDKIDKIRGMDVIFVTTANTDEEARELLSLMGAPFYKA